jgi:hypothetical protein
VAERHEIAERFAEWEIIGPPEIREWDQGERYFSQHVNVMMNAELRRFSETSPELQPHLTKPLAIDVVESFLVRLFLRRYVTYCARRRRFASMNGAARLFAEIGVPMSEPIG